MKTMKTTLSMSVGSNSTTKKALRRLKAARQRLLEAPEGYCMSPQCILSSPSKKRPKSTTKHTVGPYCKNPPKICELNWSYLCPQQFDTFWNKANYPKRKLCESAKSLEKIVKSLQVNLFLAGFSHLEPLWSTGLVRYVSYLTKATAIEPKAAAL